MDQEESSFHKAVRQGYETLVSMYPERIEVIDAEPCKEEVLKSAMECVLKVIKKNMNKEYLKKHNLLCIRR